MNDKFDELAISLAQSLTRRQALRRFGRGLAGIVVAALGLATNAGANPSTHCKTSADCPGFPWVCCEGTCINTDFDSRHCGACHHHCPGGKYWVCIFGSCVYNY